jgi:hypothetical protein
VNMENDEKPAAEEPSSRDHDVEVDAMLKSMAESMANVSKKLEYWNKRDIQTAVTGAQSSVTVVDDSGSEREGILKIIKHNLLILDKALADLFAMDTSEGD